MSYFRADTSNNQGWRPGTVNLGYMSSSRQNGPNWKTVAAQQDAAIRAQCRRQARLQSDAAYRMALVDAAARGDRVPVRMPRLSGLGFNAIDVSGPVITGAQYTFHFKVAGSVLGGVGSIDPQSIASAVATDSNFSNPYALTEPNGFQVSFSYNGVPSSSTTIMSVAGEMQDVINSHTFNGLGIFAKSAFLAAEGGPAGQLMTTNQVTTPGQQQENNPPSPSDFSIGNFLAGLGVGGAVALGLGLILVLKS